jgi:hypothetical protein
MSHETGFDIPLRTEGSKSRHKNKTYGESTVAERHCFATQERHVRQIRKGTYVPRLEPGRNRYCRAPDSSTVAHGLSPLVTGFCAEPVHEPLPVGETERGGTARSGGERSDRRLGDPDFVLAGGARAEPSRPRLQTKELSRSDALILARGMEAAWRDPQSRPRDLKGLGSRQPGAALPDAAKQRRL